MKEEAETLNAAEKPAPGARQEGLADKEEQTATISGKVYKQTGGPLGGASVRCEENECFSNGEGAYTLNIQVSEERKLVINVSCIAYASQSREIEVVQGQTSTVDFVLEKGKAGIEGHVYDGETRATVPGAYLSIESNRTYADENGYYSFTSLDAIKRYPVTAYQKGYETQMFLSDWLKPGEMLTCDIHLVKATQEQKPGKKTGTDE